MKRTMAAMSLVFTLASAQASPKDRPSEKLNKEIRKTVTYPEFAKNDKLQGLVLVAYEVQRDGSIDVIEMNASHPEFGSYVCEQLEQVQVNTIQAQGVHYAKFTFRYVQH